MNIPALRRHKRRLGGAPLVVTTAYDEPTARYADAAGVDLLLVGDSVANAVLGQADTLHVFLDDLVHHTRAVAAAAPRALIVADMPWLSYHTTPAGAVANAAALIRAGARCVKLEGGSLRAEVVEALVNTDIPVMGHLGLTPQSVLALGGYRVQAKSNEAAAMLVNEARALEDLGVCALVLECVPSVVGAMVTEALTIPTIGIGAGPETDGQVLVLHDLLGLSPRPPAKFVRTYADIGHLITTAVSQYAHDVRNGQFPNESEGYAPDADFFH